MRLFHDLGLLVERRWRDKNYDESVFPEIAAQALKETEPYKHASAWDIIRWVHTTTQLPVQRDVEANFSGVPITLYTWPRFYIDAYFWLDLTTEIHRHAFSGAFHVFAGSSILTRYSFKKEQEINAHFCTGRILLNGVELLKQGDVRTIYPGDQYIHSLFHLDRPSVTITVRTYQTPSALPQYLYLKPYLAVDPFYKEHAIIKKTQSVSLLLNMQHPEADIFIGDLVSSSDFQTTYATLETVFNHITYDETQSLSGPERFNKLLEKARSRHGRLVDLILPVFENIKRDNDLVYRRRYITNSEHRFFLALLINAPHRSMALDLVKQRFPKRNPIDTIVEWVEELSAIKMPGPLGKNVLGLIAFYDDNLFFDIFRYLLEGLTLEAIKEAIAQDYSAGYASHLGNEIEEVYTYFRESPLFKTILFDSPETASIVPAVDDSIRAAPRKSAKTQKGKYKAKGK